jgi:TonB family protein
VGNRRIVSRVSPTSPDWVATRSLDLTVTVRFQVLPDGSVKAGAVIQKTSGFPDIDARAVKALSRWRFQPAAAKSGAAEVWGRVTFRFTS